MSIKDCTICELKIGDQQTLVIVRGCREYGDERLILDEFTRSKLNVKPNEEVDVKLKQKGLLGELKWAWRASDPSYRVSARLAVLSVILGEIGLLLGIFALYNI
ncbi:MAG: hypothetical protein ABH859_02975 [Pseudomonadota bacterium]